MDDNEVRLRSLELAIGNTAGGTPWTSILGVAGRFAHFIQTGEDKYKEEK